MVQSSLENLWKLCELIAATWSPRKVWHPPTKSSQTSSTPPTLKKPRWWRRQREGVAFTLLQWGKPWESSLATAFCKSLFFKAVKPQDTGRATGEMCKQCRTIGIPWRSISISNIQHCHALFFTFSILAILWMWSGIFVNATLCFLKFCGINS